jgi:hypothetical protein
MKTLEPIEVEKFVLMFTGRRNDGPKTVHVVPIKNREPEEALKIVALNGYEAMLVTEFELANLKAAGLQISCPVIQ